MPSFPFHLFRTKNFDNLQQYNSPEESFVPANVEDFILLDKNENSFNEVFTYNRFPEAFQSKFRSTFCTYYNILPQQMVLNRSVADHLLRIFLLTRFNELSSILFVGATPPEYLKMAELADVKVANSIAEDPFTIDAEFVNNSQESLETTVIVLSSPNHFTGQALRTDTIKEICTMNQLSLIIVDESLFEYTDALSAISLLDEVENLVVIRSFSHFWGMAGVGISIAIGHPEFIEVLQNVTSPYVVDTQSLSYIQYIAESFRKSRTVFHTKTAIITERERLETFFHSSPLVEKVYPSEANFLLVSFNNDSEELYKKLLEKNIVVHYCKQPALRKLNCIRITVGSPVDNTVLMDVLQSLA